MYKLEAKNRINSLLNSMTSYANKELHFDVEDTSDRSKLAEAGELARRLNVGNFVHDLNGRSPIVAAKEELSEGRKMDAIYIIKRETGRGLKEAKDFVDNGFK
jgi:ribosomal protein L7/L12|tara:strand:- start:2842 stop:3150 length:309 start_codon:yes stop_codon:yes gene_type:complete